MFNVVWISEMHTRSIRDVVCFHNSPNAIWIMLVVLLLQSHFESLYKCKVQEDWLYASSKSFFFLWDMIWFGEGQFYPSSFFIFDLFEMDRYSINI
jgi:hypothetical protein